jgi:phosphomannomutase
MPIASNEIKFGTDGWRGIIADNFTFERLALVAPIAARVLSQTYSEGNNTVIVGYDRRFMAEAFAQTAAEAVSAAGFNVCLRKLMLRLRLLVGQPSNTMLWAHW